MRRGIQATLVGLLIAGTALADGMKIKDGRYAGGMVTTLIVTKEQLSKWPQDRWLKLNEAQRSRIKADTGVAPSEVYVYDARVGESDCTCHAWNVAFRFDSEGIDVPHEFVVSDEEAARRQAEVDAM